MNAKVKLRLLSKKAWSQKAFLLMLVPGFVYFIIYRYIPIFAGILVSMKNYKLKLGILRSPWAEPVNKYFLQFFKSPYFVPLMRNTLIISFSKILLGMPIAILLAVILNECRSTKLKRCVQTLTYMPHFLSWVVIYGMCFMLFSETNGLVNQVIRQLTGNTVPFLTDPNAFRWLIIGSDIWQSTGWSAIIYLAAISGIDPCLYEAAYIDGASRFQTIRHITLPSIATVFVMTLIVKCGNVLSAGFDQIYVMYNEAVYSTVDIIDTWVYRTGFDSFNIPLSSAVGLFKSVISFLLVITVNGISRRLGESMW